MATKQQIDFRPARRPSASDLHAWNQVLYRCGLDVNAGRSARGAERGEGHIVCVLDAVPRQQQNDDGDVEPPNEDELLSSLAYGKNLERYLAAQYAEERLKELIERFLSMSAREAASRYGLNPGTAYRLQKEFFMERADRPEVLAARKALGYPVDNATHGRAEVAVVRTALYLAVGDEAVEVETARSDLTALAA